MEDHGYTVVRPLGQAGQARVYEVRDKCGRPRVLKQLPLSGEQRSGTIKELQVLKSLRHPCIVPYHESFLCRSAPGIPSVDLICVVMTLCESDLRQACVERRDAGLGGFDEPRVLLWLTQLCWGLQHVHTRHILHRDLKPQNVLLQNCGERALLADFGVVGQVEHTEDFVRSIVGTPSFMSPEMLEGRPYNFKTDQWGLGCVLYEMMALQPAFVCTSYAQVVQAVLHSPPVKAPDGYSESLSQVLASLLARKPHDRPSNADLLRGPCLRKSFHDFLGELERSTPCVSARDSPATGRSPSSAHAGAAPYVQPLSRASSLECNTPISRLECITPKSRIESPSAWMHMGADLRLVGPIDEEASADLRPDTVTAATGPELLLPADQAMPDMVLAASLAGTQQHSSECGTSEDQSSDPWSPMATESQAPLPPQPLEGRNRNISVDTDACSYTSDFEDASAASPVASEQSVKYPYTPTGALSVRSFGSSDTEVNADGDLSPSELHNVLAEAEALLAAGGMKADDERAEVKRVRDDLRRLLGESLKIDEALAFMRGRKPLGDTLESDELMLQVEVLDLLGDEGVRALPLLERLIMLERQLEKAGNAAF